MSIAALIARVKFASRRRKASQTRRKLPSLLSRSDFYDGLEKRQLLAAFSTAGSVVTLDLNVANQVMTIAANATAYTFTLSGGATNTWTGTAGSGLSASNAVLTANATALSAFNLFSITDSQANTTVVFGNSGANQYKSNFNLTLDGTANAILFNGTSSFLNSNALTILTDSRVELPSASSLTMANGNLSMNINMQATPRVLPFSGLMVNNATIQTTGTGLTTITSRGGMGGSTSFLNKGVAVVNAGKISGGTTGTMSITGYGYTGQSANSTTREGQGVFVYNTNATANSMISSLGANVSVTGYGANDTNSNLVGTAGGWSIVNAGVVVGASGISAGTQGGSITSGGNGSVTVTGYGGSLASQVASPGSSATYAFGVSVTGANAVISSGGAGLVTVNGYGGGASANTPCGTGVFVFSGQISSGANGSVVVNGTGNSTANSANQYGIMLQGATGCIAAGSGTGTTTVTGQGGGCGTAGTGYGIYILTGSLITSLGSGNVTVTGSGGSSSGNTNHGLYMNNSTITTSANGGEVLVTGYGGGTLTSASNYGVYLVAGGSISVGGTSNVTVIGYGGNNNGTSGSNNYGVTVDSGGSGAAPGKITSSGGQVNVIGTGGGGTANSPGSSASASNVGVYVNAGGYILPGGNGMANITGYGGGRSPGATGSNNHGVQINNSNGNVTVPIFSCISSSGGPVRVTGFGGGSSGDNITSNSSTNHGVYLSTGGVITSGSNATVTVNGTGGGFGNGSSGSNYGVIVSGTSVVSNVTYRSTITSGGQGSVTINGNGGGLLANGTQNYGVDIASGAMVTAGGTTATVTLLGQGGASSGQQNYGVLIAGANTTVTSGGGNVNITGCGPLSANGANQHGISMQTGAMVTSGGNGSVTLTGTAGTGDFGTTGNGHMGVQVSGSNTTVTSGGSGPVLVRGYGGGSGARVGNVGVQVISAGVITGGANASVTVEGYGGNPNSTGGSNYGVHVTGIGSKITSNNGTVNITGYGGQTNSTVSSSSGSNVGVMIESAGEASSTGTAPITVNGTGGGLGTGATSQNVGVQVSTNSGSSLPKITSAGGLVTVIGKGGGMNGNGSNNAGVNITNGGLVSTTGSGTNISISGTGGGGSGSATSHGILIGGAVIGNNYTITANGGDILLYGKEGNGTGSLGFSSCNTLASVIGNASTAGNITIITNSVCIPTWPGSGINASSCIVIAPRTPGLGVELGSSSDPSSGPLSISGTELSRLFANTIQFGNSTTGNFTLTNGITVPSGSNLTMYSNATGTSYFPSGCASYTGISMGAGKTLDISTLPIISASILGTYSFGYYQYSRTVVGGDLSIAGKSLALSGTYTPKGGDQFSLVQATNLTGTFNGLADGSTTTFNNRTLIVNYNATSMTLTDPAPKVTEQPANTTVTSGSLVSLSANATGIPAPSVQWQVLVPGGAWSNITNATTLNYNFTSAESDNGNQYRAYFNNTYGDATSNISLVTVNYAPAITTQPTNQSANDGQTATFTAAATGNPAPSVQWQVNTGSGWANVTDGSGDTTDSYTTAAATSGMNGYQYRAIYTNGIGSYATSNAVTLTVNSATSAPSITTQPTNQTATAGNTATFTAAASGTPTPTVQWQVNTGSGWANVTDGSGGTTDSYTTAATTSGMNGYQYRAVYTNGIGSDATSNAVTLTVNAATSAPSITTQPVNTGVEAGQTATFSAAATGNPTPTVQWQSSPDGSTGWADIGGATSATLSFTASAGDNGKYYRAVFTNGISPDATTNAAKLLVGIAPVITSINEMTIPVGLTSGMTVIATGSPAPTYSIASGSLPAGVTLDSTTGLFMGTPAPGTAQSWPLTIKADNGIGNGATQAFTLKVTSTITSFTVSKGISQRSYVRYLDLGMDSNASALALLNNPSRVQLTKADLNGVGSTPISLTGFLSVPTGQSTLAIDFGTIGLGNSRNTTAADGYYTLGVDLDGNGSYETNLFFFRLFGDTNGDREVTSGDQSAVLTGCTQAYNANLDLNGDGVVNTSDYQYVKRA